MPPRSTRTRPASTGRGRGRRCTTTSAACRRFPAPGSSSRPTAPVRVKVLRTTRGEGCGRARHGARRRAHGRLRRRARCASSKCSAPAARPMKADEFLRGTPRCRRHALRRKSVTPCPATSSPSNMTARRSSAGRSRTTARRCRACWRRRSRPSAARRSRVQGAGRTDAGVHALGQVGHVDLPRTGTPTPCATRSTRICARIRSRCIAAEQVPDDVRCALLRDQAPLSLSHRQPPRRSHLERGRAWRVAKPLDSAAMHAAAQRLVGRHDFTTFRHVECQAKSPVKTLDRLDVHRDQARRSTSRPRRARSCTRQVRSMVGALVLVGEGRWTRRRSCPLRLRRATAPPARRWRRPTGSI